MWNSIAARRCSYPELTRLSTQKRRGNEAGKWPSFHSQALPRACPEVSCSKKRPSRHRRPPTPHQREHASPLSTYRNDTACTARRSARLLVLYTACACSDMYVFNIFCDPISDLYKPSDQAALPAETSKHHARRRRCMQQARCGLCADAGRLHTAARTAQHRDKEHAFCAPLEQLHSPPM